MTTTQLSHVHGASLTPLKYETIGNCLHKTAENWPNNDALVSCHQGIRLNYSQLRDQSFSVGAALLKLGLKPGDRIGIWATNCAQWTITQYATAFAGLILVNINPAYQKDELAYALNKVECKAIIIQDRFKSNNYVQTVRGLVPEIDSADAGQLKCVNIPSLEIAIVIGEQTPPGFLNFDDLSKMVTKPDLEYLKQVEQGLDPDDAINIQFTSGTTGEPKGATLTHLNILNNGFFVGERLRYSSEDRICIPLPLYHCFGMVLGNLSALVYGACAVYPAPSFQPDETLKAIEAERCTSLYGVPTMFIAMLGAPDFESFKLSSLRTGAIGGSQCPSEVMKQIMSKMNMTDATIAYGMTETSPASMQTSTQDKLEHRVETIGQVLPHIEVRIADTQNRTVARGIPGEIQTRGYSVMLGYWGDPDQTSEAIDKNGWMHTGDIGVIDEDGYAKIVGRIKDMVIRGGENIYPAEVEGLLYKNPAIAEVAVFGVPDHKYGEELCAWIQLMPGADVSAQAIKDYCKGKIAHFKIPKYIKFVDDFPMTVTGKIQKFVMREIMNDILVHGEL
ncbi:AMP-binding protein [Kordiimonas sp.]|uniref:AMP-binding protein n=1 Tax=Kordiimonas sp. TaxID=1970157 RepID=UPI003A90A00B